MAHAATQPTRQVPFCKTVVDQFAATADGYNKVGDLDPEDDMIVLVYRDGTGVVLPPIVTIEEIGAGEYGLSFTPDQIGLWVVEVRIPSLEMDWKGQYDVRAATLSGQEFSDVVRDENGRGLGFVSVEVLDASDGTTLLAAATTAYDGSYSIDLTGLLAGNPLVNLRFSGQQMVTLTKTNLRLG